MGQSASRTCCCCCPKEPQSTDTTYRLLETSDRGYKGPAAKMHAAAVASALPYTPPSEANVLSAACLQRKAPGLLDFTGFAFGGARQDGYPPPFFKRLDQYIKQNGYRARDVFLVLDHDSDRGITTDEMLSGLRRIDFELTKRDEAMLRDWMQHVVGHDLSFKEFALALKQRASLTSPQRISVIQQLSS